MMLFDKTLPPFAGANQPVRIEAEVIGLEVIGTLPRELLGSYYRMTADPQFEPMVPPVVIEPDGLVNAFHFRGDRVDLVCRYVETDRHRHERAAGRALFGGYRNRFTDDPSVAGVDRTTANTALIEHHGRLMAMKEDGLPHEIHPQTLATIGRYDFEGQVSSVSLTAHPKVDPHTGELFTYGAQAKGEGSADIAYFAFDAGGTKTAERWMMAPFPSIVHDFAVSERHAVIPVMPATIDLDRLASGGATYVWEPERGAQVAVFPRDGTGEIRWFTIDPVFAFHVVNAFEEGDLIHVDLMVAPVFPMWWPSQEQMVEIMTGAFAGDGYIAQLTRWTFDMASKTDTPIVTRLHDWDSEMPRIDERYACQPYRFAYYGVDDPSHPIAHGLGERGVNHNSIGRWDHRSKTLDTWYSGPGSSVGEPVFVPRGPDATEGDGYLLAVVQRLDKESSELVVLDAQRLGTGPVATIRPPFRLKNGVHGMWRSTTA